MKPATTSPILLLLALLVLAPAHAQVPSILNYQGRVTVGGTNVTTNAAQFKFALVDGSGGGVYWRNDGSTAAGEPATAVSIAVAQGLYSTLLGDTNLGNMAPIPPAVFTNQNVNLRVWFGNGTNGFVQLSPDQRIGAAGYALRAATADITNVPGNLTVSGTLSAFQMIGGSNNTVDADFAFLGGGTDNTIDSGASNSVISGGKANAVGLDSINVFIGGGSFNFVELGADATIAGGTFNKARGIGATVAGGAYNEAFGDDTFVAGVQSRATNDGSFVWSGTYGTDTVSTNTYSFTVRAPGGVRFITTLATNDLGISNTGGVNGVAVAPGGTAWLTLSDSNAKTAVRAVDARAVLAKIEDLDVTEWEYKHDPRRRYFGPMAQDFHRAFGLGSDDKTISTLDADGVLFLSVKGLVEELKERDEVIEELKAKIETFEQRLNSLPPTP